MGASGKLQPIDIPQADSLPSVRRIVEAIAEGASSIAQIVTLTEYSVRHVRYRFQAARILGFVKSFHALTSRGRRLLKTLPGSDEECKIFRLAVKSSPVVRTIIPNLLISKSIDKGKIASNIIRLTGLSPATAERRAQVLKSWARQLTTKQE